MPCLYGLPLQPAKAQDLAADGFFDQEGICFSAVYKLSGSVTVIPEFAITHDMFLRFDIPDILSGYDDTGRHLTSFFSRIGKRCRSRSRTSIV